jgi:hypothetical protein
MTYPLLNRPHPAVNLLLFDYVRLYTTYPDEFFDIIREIVLRTHWESQHQETPLDSIPRVLLLYWINERRFQLWHNIIQLMNADFIPRVLSLILTLNKSNKNLLVESDAMLYDMVVRDLDPQKWEIETIDDAKRWMEVIVRARESMNQLLSKGMQHQ